MTALRKEDDFFSFDDYLSWEHHHEEKHEYFNGNVVEMSGASDNHELVKGNVFASLHVHMKGKGCRVYSSDMKLKVEFAHADAGYYPDVMVVCDPTDTDGLVKTKPKAIVEVMSNFRRDHFEKFLAYQHIESLEDYLIIGQDPEERKAWLYRKATGWQQERIWEEEDRLVRLPSLDFSMPLDDCYAV